MFSQIKDIRYDIVDAVMAAGSDDPFDTWQRAAAMASEEGQKATEQAVAGIYPSRKSGKKLHD